MGIFTLPSLVGLFIQTIGALLIAVLCFVLMRTAPRDPLFYWSMGWVALCVALGSLWLSFRLLAPVVTPVYLFGEYVFGYMVFAGCRQYATGQRLRAAETWLVVPALAFAIGLPWMSGGELNVYFTIHTLIYAYLFFISYRVLRAARPHRRGQSGTRVMKVALLLLTVGYFHYSPLFALSVKGILPATVPYLEYAPFYDMLFLFMLMFGMVMVVTGEVQHELENTNAELAKTRDRLETMAQLDHLTSALNRHALYSLIEDERPGRRALLSGTAVVADIDDLKKINDRYGHLAGDSAIRAVASAIRACIRADDLLFRWGGDEFLVVLIGMSEADARVRLAAANAGLRERQLPEFPEPVDVSISMGFASFDSAHTLGQVIAIADEAMFKRKKKNGTHP